MYSSPDPNAEEVLSQILNKPLCTDIGAAYRKHLSTILVFVLTSGDFAAVIGNHGRQVVRNNSG